MTATILLAIALVILIKIIRWLNDPHDYCPRIYYQYNCRGKACDHSSRAWALIGIDKELLHSQPHLVHTAEEMAEFRAEMKRLHDANS